MDQNDKLKEQKLAINGRLLLLIAGIMLIFNAVTSTGRNGLGWLSMAKTVEEAQSATASEQVSDGEPEAGETAAEEEQTSDVSETEASGAEAADTTDAALETFDVQELIRGMEELGVTTGDLRHFGIVYLIAAFFEVIAGLIAVMFSNRVDKWKITLTAVVVLLAVELLFLIYLWLHSVLVLSVLVNALLLPLVLFWSATRFRKLAQMDPKRVLAVKLNRSGDSRRSP